MTELDLFEWFPAFLLILVRLTAFFMTLPFFAYENIPGRLKIGIALFLAWIVFITGDWPVFAINYEFVLLILKEALVGLTVGLIATILLYAIQVAGGLMDLKLGFLIANVIDPQTGTQSPMIGSYLYTFAMMFLLATNAHHLLIDGAFYSFQFIPLEQIYLPFDDENYVQYIATTFNTMFLIAFQMSLPIVGSIFLVDVALGMIARTVPQVNVFVVGLPLKIFLGFIMMFLTMAPFFMLVQNLMDTTIETMRTLMEIYGGV
ncbi:flagellar biosynthetic protein FliR [Salisediminibacterium halotolerans]|uniref:flagellar biosynthetic protein FliR n=1 Tax=Salisediminibacterium halotolerans TaxID=517425 RepID=UPI000EB333B4|nr:flagellar biosynthetic protein FliR [Salisediminibacterium halotolerans]RLJ74205.1 flagellar biosynthetic protein FliR [Actinophytocola xinjiangensis]RPE87702.1 flagellar biosynthetic protein FliR [Salisediminibacterium halotolerans]TWG35042.1 flagellar biosynthetic protein FliR [Salisediminibacterium halotolerans]GEL06671.1 flagellar biosynthetic protein FliR [Salisediminibacterium halotolerans]